ncbi:type II secretion system protein [Reinekea marinisedimentorum]|uniref:Prepilin-type N-terminal cleavage/methylation domain-containing protein n=1 Tax=Reinekea marinisedimentorum TaxID=230495 RepID=A0A4R3IAT2_9GAMM|nr:type II secretion system protein [Reinekea marinisedimentorum]TCS42540.1 prepilin-type N-terminal cleavage/methylation domain-containing protein [Reinekea marinisedimentorum]
MAIRAAQRGFSLLELMMVVLIIGVAAATVRLAVSNSDPLDQAQSTAETFIYWYSQQQDYVLMSHTDIGLYFMESSIATLTWREGDRAAGEADIVWEVLDQVNYSNDSENLTFELLLDIESNEWVAFESGISDHETLSPHVILFSSEEYEPSFLFRIGSTRYHDELIQIKADGFNRLEANRVSL